MSAPVSVSHPRIDLPYPPLWLRDNCRCSACRDPGNGQKLFSITDLATELSVVEVETCDDQIAIVFDDGHRSVFEHGWLAAQRSRQGGGDGRTEHDKHLWQASDLAGGLPESEWSAYTNDPRERLRVLRDVQRLGFAVLHGTPVEDRTVLRIAESFGHVRVTNYGELFDVRVEADPTNLAFTGLAISPHTDNPYRDPVPTMQLLHCLSNAVAGGESGLVDGFTAAAMLRADDPDAFAVLAATPVPFAWSDGTASLLAERPLIDVDGRGRVREVRFNNRSMQPVRLPYDEADAFYRSYRRFAEIVAQPDLLLALRLEAGDCLVFDNVRLLHARTAFSDNGAGVRHVQGCYADLDGLYSTIAALGAAS